MKKPKFSEEQIAYALRQVDTGTPVGDVRRQVGVSETTFTSGRRSRTSASTSCAPCGSSRTRAPEAPGGRPHVGQARAGRGAPKQCLRPTRRRELGRCFQDQYGASVLRACQLAQFSRAAWYRRSRATDQGSLRLSIRELAHARPRFGYLRIWVLLRREGWVVNRKRFRRLYRLEGLQLRMRVRRRKHIALHRGPAPAATGPGERWSMDFVHDVLADGRPLRVLTVVDQRSRQSPILETAFRTSGTTAANALARAIGRGTPPRSIAADHGTDFMSRVLEDWAYARGVALDFTRPGKTTDIGQTGILPDHATVLESPDVSSARPEHQQPAEGYANDRTSVHSQQFLWQREIPDADNEHRWPGAI